MVWARYVDFYLQGGVPLLTKQKFIQHDHTSTHICLPEGEALSRVLTWEDVTNNSHQRRYRRWKRQLGDNTTNPLGLMSEGTN